MEKDDELKGEGNSYDLEQGFRSRIDRWLVLIR
jgi:hypothetical protein